MSNKQATSMGKKKEPSVTIVDKPKVINVEYQLLLAERDDLLEAEIGYKRRLDQLEHDAKDMLKSFDILYNENKILRSKLETPDGVGEDSAESYTAIYKDRQHLREANKAFKRRIQQLEDDKEDSVKEYNSLYSKHQLVTQKAQLDTEYATKSRDEKITEMERNHQEVTERLKMFLKEREQYEYRIAEMDKEMNELQNKHDFLASDKHELQLRCDVLQADREKLKDKVMDLENKIPDPEQKAKEEQQFLSTQGQLVALQITNKDLSVEIHKLKEEIRVLQKMKKENVEMIDRASSVIVDEETQEREREELLEKTNVVNELKETKERGIFILKENDKLKSANADFESKVANFELENKRLQEELNSKKTQIEDMSVLVSSGESLNKDYNIMQAKLNDLAALRQALENELIQEKRISKLKIMELDNELDKTKQKLNEEQKLNGKKESMLQKLQYENDTLQKVVDAQALELRNMKAQLEQIQNILEDRNIKYEQMQNSDKESTAELRDARLQLHTVQRELESLKTEKRGHFNHLKEEMESAKAEREEEKEQLRKETVSLKEEVKKLKDYEYKITTMDAEIRRLMNRLRMTEQFRSLSKTRPRKDNGETDQDRAEIKELKRKKRELEKEKLALLQDRKQWDVLKGKYADLQKTNQRLVSENKRVRGDLDGTSFKVDSLEKRFRTINVKTDDIKEPGKIQRATYVDNSLKQGSKSKPRKANEQQRSNDTDRVRAKDFNTTKRERRHVERKSTRTALDISKMRAKKPVLPEIKKEQAIYTEKGYKELHKDKYNKGTLALL